MISKKQIRYKIRISGLPCDGKTNQNKDMSRHEE